MGSAPGYIGCKGCGNVIAAIDAVDVLFQAVFGGKKQKKGEPLKGFLCVACAAKHNAKGEPKK
jgi:hypothetical protein